MASDRTRGEGQSSPSREQDGVRTGGNLPAPGVTRVGDVRGDEFVESSVVDVGPREVSSIRQAIPKFGGKPESFPVWSNRVKAFVSMSGCLGSLRADVEIAEGDTTKVTQQFLSQGLTHSNLRNARVAWIRLTKIMSDADLLDRAFSRPSPSGAWKMRRSWFLPRSIATQVK